MKKLKIAQIGIGHDHGSMVFDSLKKQDTIFEVVGYVLPEKEEQDYGQKLGCFDGFDQLSMEEILNDPEIVAVTIETEEKNLTKYAIMAAEHKKHIHMDKPGGMVEADFEKLLTICRENNLILHMGYMYRYNPEIIQLMRAVKAGELGEIFAVEAQMGGIFPFTPEKRQWLEQFEGGILFFLGCHMIDLVLSIQGMPERIIPLNKSTGLEGVSAKDYGMVIFEYPNGTSFIKTCAREVRGFDRRQLVVCGSKKTVEIKPLEFYERDGMHTEVTTYSGDACERRVSEAYDRYDAMMASFAAMARGEKDNPWSYDYEWMLYQCILKSCR